MIKKDEVKNFFLKLTIQKANYQNTIIATIVFMIYFLLMGIVLFSLSDDLFEFNHQISGRCLRNKCEIKFEIQDDFSGPFYIYIGYRDFYLNHRKIAQSVDWNQIRSAKFKAGSPSFQCKDFYLNQHGVDFYPEIFSNKNLTEIMNPCGLFSLLYVDCIFKR